MVGFVSQDGGNPGVNPFDLSQVPSSPGQGVDWLGTTKMLGGIVDHMAAEAETVDKPGITPGRYGEAQNLASRGAPTNPQGPVVLQPEEANKLYGADGLKFSNPVPASVASDMAHEHQMAQMRADAAARTAPGILPHAEHDALSFAAGLLDPTNIAASFVPGFGEEAIGSAIAKAGLEGVAGKVATRAATGAIAGAAGQLPLTALSDLSAGQNQEDFTFGDAARQVLMGAAFGGVLHPVVGAVADLAGHTDPISERFRRTGAARQVEKDPILRETAARTAIAAVANGHEVDVAPLIELGARERERALALRSLQYDSSQPIGMRLNALEDDLTAPGAPEPVRENLAEQHAALQDIKASQADIEAAKSFQLGDEATRARIDAIDDELTQPGVLSPNRAAALAAERRMLTEGAAPVTDQEKDLQSARTAAQIQGNQIAIGRNNARIGELQDQIRSSSAAFQATHDATREELAASRAMSARVAETKPARVAPAPEADELKAWEETLKQSAARGELSQSDSELLDELSQNDQDAEKYAKAHEAFGACMAGSI